MSFSTTSLEGPLASNPRTTPRSNGLEKASPTIRRRHYFELHDQPWWPTPLREFMTNLLIIDWTFPWISIPWNGANIVPSFLSITARLVNRFLDDLDLSGQPVDRVVDLCSGAGGPWPSLLPLIRNRRLRITLSDLYPPPAQPFPWLEEAGQQVDHGVQGRLIEYYRPALDATHVPKHLMGLRSLCGCFHHFHPETGTAIFQDCIDQRIPVIIVESAARQFIQKIAAVPFMSILALATPIAFPRKTPWYLWILTYIFPFTLICAAFDGTASCFRSYHPDEMLALAAQCTNSDTYVWKAGNESFFGLFSLVYLTGRPMSPAELKTISPSRASGSDC